MGIYKIFIKSAPMSKYPPFFTIDDNTGTSQPVIIKNGIIVTTSAEI